MCMQIHDTHMYKDVINKYRVGKSRIMWLFLFNTEKRVFMTSSFILYIKVTFYSVRCILTSC